MKDSAAHASAGGTTSGAGPSTHPAGHRSHHPRADRARKEGSSLGLTEATALAVGGMIGGGIFSVLGVTITMAGHLAWACFVLAGVVALLTARSYVALASASKAAGGPFGYLRELGHEEVAGWIGWLLVLGYVFAMAVYAFTFGRYLANVFGAPVVVARLASLGVVAALVLVNLRGVSASGRSEDVIVIAKVLILAAVSAVGVLAFDVHRLQPVADKGAGGVFVGAAVIFVAYEGFELLSYDRDDIADPERTLPGRSTCPSGPSS